MRDCQVLSAHCFKEISKFTMAFKTDQSIEIALKVEHKMTVFLL